MEELALNSSVRPTCWYKLRITLDDTIYDPAMPGGKFRHFISTAREFKNVIDKYTLGKVVGGIEVHNKLGEYTFPHVHFHFTSHTKKDTIIKQLKRTYLSMYEEALVGNKMYSCKIEVDVNYERFFRYSLKQYEAIEPIIEHKLCSGFSTSELESFRKVAYAQHQLGQEVHQTKADKREIATTKFARACLKLDKLENPSKLDIALGIQEIYLKDESPINNNTIAGYTLAYCLKRGIISKEENAQKILSLINL